MFNRTEQRRGREGCVHNQREMMFLRNSRVLLDVGDVKHGVAHGFNVDSAGFLVDCGLGRGEIVHRSETDVDALLRENRIELSEGSAVKVVCGNELIALFQDVGDGKVDRRGSAGEGKRGGAAVELSQAFLKHVVGGVHQTAVDVSGFAQREQVCAVFGAFEIERCRAVDRNRAGERGGIGFLSGVKSERFDMVFAFAHRVKSPV